MTERTDPDQVATTGSDGSVPGAGPVRPLRSRKADRASATISAVLLVVFVGAFLNALQWQAIAGLFPLTVTAIGAVLSTVFLVRSLTGRGPRPVHHDPGGPTPQPGGGSAQAPPSVGDPVVEQPEDDSEHAFFASLGRREWLVSLGCFAAFFVLLALAGLYVATVLFTIAYLRYQATSSWRLSVIYAVVLAVAMYGLFGAALQLPVPGGLLGLA